MKINKLIIVLFLSLVFLNFSFATIINLANNQICNNYEFVNDQDGSLKGSPQIAIGCVQICSGDTNLTVPASDCDSHVNTQRMIINNLGQIQFSGYWSGGGYWPNSASCICGTATPYTLPSNICFNGACDFYYAEGLNKGNQGCNRANGSNIWTSQVHANLYSGCLTPQLRINTPIGGTILSNAYRFNFSILNTYGWAGIGCSFSLDGSTNDYSTYFTDLETQFDILFTTYPRQFTIAKISCNYLNELNHSTMFANQEWLVDSANNVYNIANLQREQNTLDLYPSHPYPYVPLYGIGFRVVNIKDLSDYHLPITVSLSSNTDLGSLNCSGSFNFSGTNINLQSPPYTIFLTNYTSCNNIAVIPVNLTAYDQYGNYLASLTNYNINWSTGYFVIDNINIVKNIKNGNNTELWASLSTDYDKIPLPTNASPSCNYSVLSSKDSVLIGGKMDIQNILNTATGNSPTYAYNNSIFISNNSYEIDDRFLININCSANGYTSKSITDSYRWLAFRRLKEFSCILQNNNNHQLSFSNDYKSDNAMVSCTIYPDMEVNSSDVQDISNQYKLLGQFPTKDVSVIYINQNINPSACLSNLNELSFSSYDYILYASNYYNRPINFFKANLPTCDLQKLSNEKVSKEMVEYNFNYINTYGPILSPTYADLTFDLMQVSGLQIYGTKLSILNSKTINPNIIERGDMIACISSYKDPVSSNSPYTISYVSHKIMDVNTKEQCDFITVPYPPDINNTINDISKFEVNEYSCPFFANANKHGSLECIADYYTISDNTKPFAERISNLLSYKTPLNTPSQNKSYNVSPTLPNTNNTVGSIQKWATQNVLSFALVAFIIILTSPLWIRVLNSVYSRRIKRE
jgi:hypothetical protein